MLVEDVVNSDTKYVVIGRDSDGHQWEILRGANYDDAIDAAVSEVEDDLRIYGDEAVGKKTGESSWRVHSPKHDYTSWISVYVQNPDVDRDRELDDAWHDGTEVEEGIAWKKRGNKIVRQYRCVSGNRKGRVVANPGQCFKPIDLKKRMSLRRTKARMGTKATRKAKRTKKFNPVSKRVKAMNKRR